MLARLEGLIPAFGPALLLILGFDGLLHTEPVRGQAALLLLVAAVLVQFPPAAPSGTTSWVRAASGHRRLSFPRCLRPPGGVLGNHEVANDQEVQP